jgi:flagellar hook protein FlgE
MGYEQGLSGLDASENDLNVIGNNIANANTDGFKQSTAIFADVYANSIATTVNNQIGLGTQLAAVQQDFSQGQLNTTGDALNVAINGQGFFQMDNNGELTYSRNGVFQVNAAGYITNVDGLQLMGYAVGPNGTIDTAQTVPLQVPQGNIAPSPTTTITAQLNLNSMDTTPTTTPFSPTDSSSYNFTTSTEVYDSLGGSQQVNLYFVKTAPNTWEAYGEQQGATTPTDLGTLNFSTSGVLTSTTVGGVTSPGDTLNLTIPNTDGSATPQTLAINFTGTTQYGSADGVDALQPNGYASGTLANMSIGANGTITGTYSNGETQTLGQIVLANFADPNGLQDLGNNEYGQTNASGAALISTPGSTNHGTLQGGAVEESNVDLTSQLVDLITAQRNYQANAQTIKTQQTVDQTLMQL